MEALNRKSWVWGIGIFLTVFAAELGYGIYLSVMRSFVYYDAVSRVANAFYVMYSRDPHLGAIGFVWNPLPSLLEMGPLLLWPVLPVVASSGLAANIVSALFAAGTSVILFRFTYKYTESLRFALLLMGAYSFNPFIFVYGANGMSEAMFSFFIMWIVISLLKWIKENQPYYPISMGLALAFAFWVRYEAIALGIGLTLAIIAIMVDRSYTLSRFDRIPRRSKESLFKIESTLIVVLTPAVFSGLAWLFLNAIIMGDALYFFRSGYSNLAFSGNITDDFQRLIATPLGVLWLVLRKSLFFALPLLSILMIRIWSGRLFRADTFAILLLSASIPAMQYAMLINGSSFGWLRFFVYPFVVAVAWIPYELQYLRQRGLYHAGAFVLLVTVLISSFVVLDMNNQQLSPDEYELFRINESGTYKDLTISREASHYTNSLIEELDNGGELLFLTDAYSAYSVILNSKYPKQWVITNDQDFMEILADPYAHGVNYILVSKKIGSVLQIIHEMYPNLFDEGTHWTELERDFAGEWRLYRVIGTTK